MTVRCGKRNDSSPGNDRTLHALLAARRGRRTRQRHRERAALARRTLQRNVAAEEARQVARNAQAEAGAAGAACVAALDLAERLEDALVELRKDAGAGVADTDHDVRVGG